MNTKPVWSASTTTVM